LHVTLRASYAESRSPLWALINESSATDFKDKTSVSLDMRGNFARVGESGEIQSSMIIKEGEESYRVATYANSVALTRELIVNDNLGALNGIGTQLGQDAARWQDDWLIDQLLGGGGNGPLMADGVPVFDPSRRNLVTPGASLGKASVGAAKLHFHRMTTTTGKLTPLVARTLIVPPEMEIEALEFLAAISPTKSADVNTFAGAFTLIVEPRLTDSKAWYLVVDKSQAPGFEYAYLSGAAGPQIESENSFDTFAIKYRVWFDLGGGWLDHRGWYKNSGAL
jgi:hypothetical protein